MRREYSKAVSLGIITVVYVIAAAAGILAFGKLGAALGETWALLAADVIATVIVWGFGFVHAAGVRPVWPPFGQIERVRLEPEAKLN